jgi:nitric oxide reductase subunit B
MERTGTAPAAGAGDSGLGTQGLRYKSQRVAYPYFVVSAALFLLQVIFGLLIAAYFIWPTYWSDVLPFNIGRETHLNLLIFWLLLGLMGASYYLIPEEAQAEIFSVRLAWVQLGVMVLAGLGTLGSFWFLRQSNGKPFTESPMPWPVLIAAGVVLFLINICVTLFRARRWTAISIVLVGGMTGLALMYLINFAFFPNLTVDYYYWWWIIHLWVEGAWELITAAIMSFLLVKLTGVELGRMSRWLYLEVALTLFTGIVGIGHHYYWIGTPAYWLWWGAIFSALEPVPIAIMVYDAFHSMRHRKAEPSNRVAWYFVGGSAIGHLIGAGGWGFAQTLPQINQWTHGTEITASHGHFAFFGAFGMLVLAAIYYMLPNLQGLARPNPARGRWSFALMSIGMAGMVLAFTMAGLVQTYMIRVAGLDFMQVRTQYMSLWMFLVWFIGLIVFLPGTVVYVWEFLRPRPAR